MRLSRLLAVAVTLAGGAALGADDVSLLVATSADGAVRLKWTNPSAHDGVLVVRTTGAFDAAPVDGLSYLPGDSLGTQTVVYADSGGSSVASFADSALTNGTTYHYKVYNLAAGPTYASGNVPSSAGLSATPTSRAAPAPLYCFSTGSAAVMQPVTELGVGIFFAGNGGAVSATLTSADPATDGDERWRPLQLGGAVQSRFPVVMLQGDSQKTLLVGDQSGRAYAINAETGALRWTGNSGAALGDAIQAQLVVQLNAYASAAFKAANPGRDLVFVGTRNLSATSNKVYALSSADGAIVWTYAPSDLDVINGGMFVDYVRDRVWVASRSNGDTQASLRVLDSLTGAEVFSFSLGDIDSGVVRDYASDQAYVVTTSGTVHGRALSSGAAAFSQSVGATASYVMPVGNGFIASVKSGTVERWAVSGNTATQSWSTAVAGPTGVTIDYARQKTYLGSTDGQVHQLDLATGADEKQVTVSSDAVGTPTVDATSGRLHVGTLTGEVCAFALPL